MYVISCSFYAANTSIDRFRHEALALETSKPKCNGQW